MEEARSLMDLTDEELEAIHSCLFEEVHYGDDEVVYGYGDYAFNLRSALAKVDDEARRRKFWWAR